MVDYFDYEFYKSYGVPHENNIELVIDYLQHGWLAGRDPAPWFSTSAYLAMYQDVADSKINPFVHYILYGKAEGRETSLIEDAGFKLVDTAEQSSALHIDALFDFTIRGWAHEGNYPIKTLKVTCENHHVQCVVVAEKRADVVEKLGLGEGKYGFFIDLPGYIWSKGRRSSETKSVSLSIYSAPKSKVTLKIEKLSVVRWADQILSSEHADFTQLLLCIEHVYHSGTFSRLSEQSQARVASLLRTFKLTSYLKDLNLAADTKPSHDKIDLSTSTVWAALTVLNANCSRMCTKDAVSETIKAFRFGPKDLREFKKSTVGILCADGETAALAAYHSEGLANELSLNANVWSLSLATALLCSVGRFREATAHLWTIADRSAKGWLDTNCILYCTKQVELCWKNKTVGASEAEQLRYAVFAVIEKEASHWYGRGSDVKLIESLIEFAKNDHTYPDYHARDLSNAILKCYGLNPKFWSLVQSEPRITLNSRYRYAKHRWEEIESADYRDLDNLETCIGHLKYFRRIGCYDADVFLREVLITYCNERITAGFKLRDAELDAFNEISEADRLRLLSNPYITNDEIDIPLDKFAFRESISAMRGTPQSVFSGSQFVAAQAISRMEEASQQGRYFDGTVLNLFKEVSTTLSDASATFLGIDLLAWMLRYAEGADRAMIFHSFRAAVETLLSDGPINPAPASLFSSFQRLEDVQLSAYEHSIHESLFAKAAHRVPELLTLRGKGSGFQANMRATGRFHSDTLVAVYSCNKYLDTRVFEIRNSWLKNLSDMGIPFVVVVGDGDDSLDGDVLRLNVSDKYEDLPAKTLALLSWFFDQTSFTYMLKIDDDCFLDVDKYFKSLSHRKFHYYGRLVTRGIGSTDRAWHQEKSSKFHAKMSLDRSPEPSEYADGGGAYSLSRYAISQILASAAEPQGQRLISVSYMEDKLVGDLLGPRGIRPVNENYESYQRRRTFASATTVGMWENTFFPGMLSPTKVVHLDDHKDLSKASGYLEGASYSLYPKKLWPTDCSPAIAYNSNQLELLSSSKKVLEHASSALAVVCVVRNEIVMLPHFLDHYRRLGVMTFYICDNLSTDGTREFLLAQPDVVLYSADAEYKVSHYGVSWQHSILAAHCVGRWSLVVDADEFIVYNDCEHKNLSSFVYNLEAENADGCVLYMVDMYPEGPLKDADFAKEAPFACAPWFDRSPIVRWQIGSGQYSNHKNYVSGFRHRLSPLSPPNSFTTQKFALFKYKPWMRFSEGLHDGANIAISRSYAFLAHFKYHLGFRDKVLEEIDRAQHYDNAAEYKRYLRLLEDAESGFCCKQKSMEYVSSSDFYDIDLSCSDFPLG
ncbi:glycosyltransferase family 2 protein [Methylobacterium hispanicum]|uniref:glycosyltransferase family 2 protein n=1 Tax=Methylobacterium hispanicum TaxID=270350 RepID=UPI002F34FCF4